MQESVKNVRELIASGDSRQATSSAAGSWVQNGSRDGQYRRTAQTWFWATLSCLRLAHKSVCVRLSSMTNLFTMSICVCHESFESHLYWSRCLIVLPIMIVQSHKRSVLVDQNLQQDISCDICGDLGERYVGPMLQPSSILRNTSIQLPITPSKRLCHNPKQASVPVCV